MPYSMYNDLILKKVKLNKKEKDAIDELKSQIDNKNASKRTRIRKR